MVLHSNAARSNGTLLGPIVDSNEAECAVRSLGGVGEEVCDSNGKSPTFRGRCMRHSAIRTGSCENVASAMPPRRPAAAWCAFGARFFGSQRFRAGLRCFAPAGLG